MAKGSKNNVAMTVLSSIILTILIVSIVNVGLSIFLESPDYSDYCDFRSGDKFESREVCEANGGAWEDFNVPPSAEENLVTGYCDTDKECREEYDRAQQSFNQIRYYVFAILGIALFFVGASAGASTVGYTGFASGGILLLEGIVTNLENKVMVFVSLLIILGIFGYLVFKKLEKK